MRQDVSVVVNENGSVCGAPKYFNLQLPPGSAQGIMRHHTSHRARRTAAHAQPEFCSHRSRRCPRRLGGPLFLIHPEKSVSDSFGACEFAASREFTRDFVGRGTPLVGNDDGAVTGGHLRAFRIAHHEPDQVATGLDVKAGFHRKSGMAEALIGRVA